MGENISKLRVDKNYNIINTKNSYDDMFSVLSELEEGLASRKISEKEFRFLMMFLIQKFATREIRKSLKWLVRPTKKSNTFINYSEKETKYA